MSRNALIIVALVSLLLVNGASAYKRLPYTRTKFYQQSKALISPLTLRSSNTWYSPIDIKGRDANDTPVLLPDTLNLIRGTLPNGLKYLILPTPPQSLSRPGSLEARLEIHAGSTIESDKQQGMAHLLEHVTFMDNPSRKQLCMQGVHTNAYTDFHQTVFTASLPSSSTSSSESVPVAAASSTVDASPVRLMLDSFRDIFTFGQAEISSFNSTGGGRNHASAASHDCLQRLQKEQNAILSEANLVNNMKYRHESEVLCALHHENIISKRFPLGDIDLMQNFTPEELLSFHSKHYNPQNAILYLVGDMNQFPLNDEKYIIQVIHDTFTSMPMSCVVDDHSCISAMKKSHRNTDIISVSADSIMTSISKHFPPVTHHWSSNVTTTENILRMNQYLKSLSDTNTQPDKDPTVHTKTKNLTILKTAMLKTEIMKTTMMKTTTDLMTKLVSSLSLKSRLLKSNEEERKLPSAVVLKQNTSNDVMTVRVFAKQPIETINSKQRFRNRLMRKLILNALSIRCVESLFVCI
jgi:hypothetical protein